MCRLFPAQSRRDDQDCIRAVDDLGGDIIDGNQQHVLATKSTRNRFKDATYVHVGTPVTGRVTYRNSRHHGGFWVNGERRSNGERRWRFDRPCDPVNWQTVGENPIRLPF